MRNHHSPTARLAAAGYLVFAALLGPLGCSPAHRTEPAASPAAQPGAAATPGGSRASDSVSAGAASAGAASAGAVSAGAASAGAAPDEHRHGLHKDFSDAQRFSQAFDDPARDAWQRPAEVIQLLDIEPGSVVADLGTGTGYFVSWLSRAVGPRGKVLALDVEPEMIEFVARRAEQQHLGNVEPRQVSPDDPGLAPGSVARVLIVDTWHHIDDRAVYAGKLARALAPGGEVWIVDFTPDSDIGPPAKYRIAADQAVRELEAGGLRAEVVSGETLPKQYVVRGTLR